MKHRVMGDRRSERFKLTWCGQFPVDQQVAGFEKVTFLGQLLNRITSVPEDSSIPVQISDRAGGSTRVCIPLVERDVSSLLEQFGDVDGPIVFSPDMDRHREGFIADF